MRIAVFGANGATGRRLLRQSIGGEDELVMLVRRPEALPFRDPRWRVVAGDVRDPEAVARTVAGADAVISTLGVPFSRDPIDLYSVGARTIVDAMRRHGVGRLAVTSSSAVEPHAPTEGWLFERVLQPSIVNGIGRTTYEDMRRAERIVADSGLGWTLVRPSGLFPAEQPTRYRATTAHAPGRFTSRADLAHFLLRQAREPEWIGARPEIHTDEGAPGILRVIWNEGIRRRPDPILLDQAGADGGPSRDRR